MNLRSLLLLIASCTVTANAQPAAQPLTFAVATVRPSNADRWKASFTPTGYLARGAKFRIIIQDAFGIYEPGKVDEADLDRFHHLTDEQRQAMLQALLANRFKLVFHHQAREVPVYDLIVAKGGSKLLESKGEELSRRLITTSQPGALAGQNFSMGSLASLLSPILGRDITRHVIDKTGLTGNYTFALHWTPENTPDTSPIAGGPSIFTALQEQLGLKLEPAKDTIDTLVIDHVEQPSEN